MPSNYIISKDIIALHKKRAGHALGNEKYTIYKNNGLELLLGYCNETLTFLENVANNEINIDSCRCAFTDFVSIQLDEYLSGKRKTFDIPYKLYGTDFQMKVWTALTKIPYGETRSYKEIAESIESPRACRAVGMANHYNPIMIVIPCHRVIGSSGSLVGYGGGIDLKEKFLKIEKENKCN